MVALALNWPDGWLVGSWLAGAGGRRNGGSARPWCVAGRPTGRAWKTLGSQRGESALQRAWRRQVAWRSVAVMAGSGDAGVTGLAWWLANWRGEPSQAAARPLTCLRNRLNSVAAGSWRGGRSWEP